VFGWASIIAAICFAARWSYRIRGWVDEYLAHQKEQLETVAKVLAAVEESKKVAVEQVALALKEGSIQASEIKVIAGEAKERSEANSITLQTLTGNHIAHLAISIENLNGKTDKMVEVLGNIDKNIAVLVDRTPRA
jgi:hypothetical protein